MDLQQRGERVVVMYGEGTPVKEIGRRLGVGPSAVYADLKRAGVPAGRPNGPVKAVDEGEVVAEFARTGKVSYAARVVGVSHGRARAILVRAGVVSAEPAFTHTKPTARYRPPWRGAEHPTIVQPLVTVAEPGVHQQDSACISAVVRGDTSSLPVGSRALTLEQRLTVADGLTSRWSQARIAAAIGKDRTTVWREITAGSVDGQYQPYQADSAAQRRRRRPKVSKLAPGARPRLYDVVAEGLSKRWSPQQISVRMIRDHPGDKQMRVSHETIYQAMYLQARGGLKKQVAAALRSGRARRVHQGQRVQRERFKDPMINIAERPEDVRGRLIPGHWEGDLITGAYNKSAIGTLVERTTRHTMLLHLPDDHTAGSVTAAIGAAFEELPKTLKRSLTWDQGSELAEHVAVATRTGMDVYFCDPASPWQRGTNENTNGLLRQYFPKGTDLSVHSRDHLAAVAAELNDRPRRALEYDTPSERFRQLISNEGT